MNKARAWTTLWWGAVLLAACGGSTGSIGGPVGAHCSGTFSPGPGSNWGQATESANDTCGAPLMSLIGTKSPGNSCKEAADCKPTCCACATGTKITWAALCLNGVCASSNDTCCEVASETPPSKTCQ